jgi:hypothetical protein
MASNLETLKDFLDTINNRNAANHHSVDHLMTLFCGDDEHQGFPFVGITERGPQFRCQKAIRKLFNQLLKVSFHDMAWRPANALRLTEENTIAVEMDVTAKHVREWFQDESKSPPLSQIAQHAIDGLGAHKKTMEIPACAVFTFDGNHRIKQLAIYIDRYKMMHQLAPAHWTDIELPEDAFRPPSPRIPTQRSAAQTSAGLGRRVTIVIEG